MPREILRHKKVKDDDYDDDDDIFTNSSNHLHNLSESNLKNYND